MSEPEKRLWSKLRSRQLHGYKFRRQHGIERYIVDFFCSELGVVVEVDGKTHTETKQIAYDEIRDRHLKLLGLSILRYTNFEVMSNLEGVLLDLEKHILQISTSPSPSLQRRGDV